MNKSKEIRLALLLFVRVNDRSSKIEMEMILPLEMARLVLGYLKDENCVETA